MTKDQSASRSDALKDWLRDNAPDCGDNSCLFGGKGKGGMRTNGGCRCYRDVRPDMKRIYIERLQAFVSEQQPSDTDRLKWLLDDYRRIDLHNAIGTMSYDLDVCRKAIDKTMQSERNER